VKDVGLMTGDQVVNKEASCIVMTTEILRSMLYRGANILREVAWVIFDEIHYMRDLERGVVWEESILMLPPEVKLVFLSATMSNAREFASWIAHVKQQPCHLVATDYRPIPLQHYLYPQGGNGIYLILDEVGSFHEENFNKGMATCRDPPHTSSGKSMKGVVPPSECLTILELIIQKNFDPVVVFSFSRTQCETLASYIAQRLPDLNSTEERKLVQTVFDSALDQLDEHDRSLPHIQRMLPLLLKGIGVHHSGLLPIVKEVVEILFQEHLIKVLIATETFAMGLNMPARTVLFTSMQKFDGKDNRWLTPGEYIQMSGRAGRRNVDTRGICIIIGDRDFDARTCRQVVTGKAEELVSSFRLRYSSLLGMIRASMVVRAEDVIKRSFRQFQSDHLQPQVERRLNDLESERAALERSKPESDTLARDYYRAKTTLDELTKQFRAHVMDVRNAEPFLKPGRLVQLPVIGKTDPSTLGAQDRWGVLVRLSKKQRNTMGTMASAAEGMGLHEQHMVSVLVNCKPSADANAKDIALAPLEDKADPRMIRVPLASLEALSAIRIFVPDLRNAENRKSVIISLREVKKRFPDGVPLLDPIEQMGIITEDFIKIVERIEKLEGVLFSSPLHRAPDRKAKFEAYAQSIAFTSEISAIKKLTMGSQLLMFHTDLKNRSCVLKRLGFITNEGILTSKGQVAAEITAADELVLTEVIFDNVFAKLSPVDAISILACFLPAKGSKNDPKNTGSSLKGDLSSAYRAILLCAQRVGDVCVDSLVEIDVEEYLKSFRPVMVDVVQAWASGAEFTQVCSLVEVFEGDIVRSMRFLDELVMQLCAAAHDVGDSDLHDKLMTGVKLIRRGVVVAGSLYT